MSLPYKAYKALCAFSTNEAAAPAMFFSLIFSLIEPFHGGTLPLAQAATLRGRQTTFAAPAVFAPNTTQELRRDQEIHPVC
jgi:hypothetical protein